ncbi:MAG TPA: hypothetical protein VGP73_18520 [Thermoanaerobaculia bacterium]
MQTATEDKLETLAKQYGYSVEELIAEYALDDTVPGICMNPGCEYVTEYEPDQKNGWCGACRTTTVRSALILAGVI